MLSQCEPAARNQKTTFALKGLKEILLLLSQEPSGPFLQFRIMMFKSSFESSFKNHSTRVQTRVLTSVNSQCTTPTSYLSLGDLVVQITCLCCLLNIRGIHTFQEKKGHRFTHPMIGFMIFHPIFKK